MFMFAGHDTTTAAGSFTLNFIAENPRVLKNCRKELQEVFGESGRQPTYSDLSKLTYLNACIRESLRLRAPVREYFRFIFRLLRDAYYDYHYFQGVYRKAEI